MADSTNGSSSSTAYETASPSSLENVPSEFVTRAELQRRKEAQEKARAVNQPTRRARKPERATIKQEIQSLQGTTHLLVSRAPFHRVVREILLGYKCDARISSEAIEALRESSEIYLTQIFEDANLLLTHAKRVTVLKKDIELVKCLRGPNDPGCYP